MGCGDNKNPLKRGGTSQQERSLAAMNTSYARVDEHGFKDWIFFAGEFSRFLHYFDNNNKKTGDWSPFFTSDVSAQLASAAIQNIDQYRQLVKQRFDFLKDDDHRADTTQLEANLNDLLSALFTLSKALDAYWVQLPDDITLKNTLLNLIQSKLSISLYRLIGYYRAANEILHYLDQGLTDPDWRIFNQNITPAASIISGVGLSKNWWVVKNGSSLLNYAWLESNQGAVPNAGTLLASITNWADYVLLVVPDESIFTSALVQPADPEAEKTYRRLQHAANHNLFTGVFDQFLSGYAKVVNDASAELEKTLTNRDSHQPHYALFLSFLKLFQFAQQQVNTITKRHLDFYYKEVLRLKPKDAVPNKVHVLVDLAKQIDQYLLQKETRLKAGKDSEGKDVVYALDGDTTFNKARVAELRSFYMAAEKDSVKDFLGVAPVLKQDNDGRLFAAPIANSADGLGAELKTPLKEWHPFANRELQNGLVSRMNMPMAEIGFAVASHYLYLAEGSRKIMLKLVTNNNDLLLGKHFDCYVTTAKGWLKTPDPDIRIAALTSSATTSCAQLEVILNGSQPAVIPFNAAVHNGDFQQPLPVIKFILRQADLLPYEYEDLRTLTVSTVEVRVEVGDNGQFAQNGLKDIQLANDAGALDAAKPFQPFGLQPKKHASLFVGNKEVFSKKNTSLQINLEWANLPDSKAKIKYTAASDTDATTPNVEVNFLEGGIWVGHTQDSTIASSLALFAADNKPKVSLGSQAIPAAALKDFGEAYEPLSTTSKSGFIKLILNADFGHKLYQDDLTIHLINQSKPPVTTAAKFGGTEPYSPTLQSLYISYTSWQNSNLAAMDKAGFETREICFFHLHPFGVAEQHNYLNKTFSTPAAISLLPQFRFVPTATTKPAEFYIGLEHLQANQVVNILFQVLEGTTNPQVAKPKDHIKWSYLSNNFWFDFDNQEISDATLGLLQSGIISFSIPAKATTANTLMPSGKLWLRAAIGSAAEAVAKLISVDAQAAVGTFLPRNNAANFLDAPMAAGSISKLEQPDAAIKKISQPYPAFGGRPKESESHFYMRVSERLRHKGRAITIWDYEHLILEAFPEIYKVKCLNHTGLVTEGSVEITNEMKPGHVLLITIPSLKNRNDANPLQPYTNQDTLTRIENFIKEKVSPFVTVAARQPLFEEIGISFALKLQEQYRDFTFYTRQLQEEIVRFLTPWAYDSNAEIQFGGKVYKSSLINFIEERHYVDYITDVVLHHSIGTTTNSGEALEVITASTARSILVSAPAGKHTIVPATPIPAGTNAECAAVVSA